MMTRDDSSRCIKSAVCVIWIKMKKNNFEKYVSGFFS